MLTTRVRPRREDVRADILTRAIESFEKFGYAGTSLAAVAAAAGYTKGAVYSGFGGGKPELFAAACSERLAGVSRAMMSRVEPVLGSAADRDVLVDHLAEAIVTATLDSPLRWQILLNEFRTVALRDAAVDEVYRTLSKQRVDFLVDLFTANDYLARLGRERLARAAVMLLALVNAMALEHALAPDVVDRTSIEGSIRALLRSVLPA